MRLLAKAAREASVELAKAVCHAVPRTNRETS